MMVYFILGLITGILAMAGLLFIIVMLKAGSIADDIADELFRRHIRYDAKKLHDEINADKKDDPT